MLLSRLKRTNPRLASVPEYNLNNDCERCLQPARVESWRNFPGDLVCRFWYPTYSDVNYYTCTELSKKFSLDLDFFFTLNPTVLRDCSNIQPVTEYCVAGSPRATDGFCGPRHNNATCFGTAAPCCNAVTFTCGNSEGDCAPGTCYEGKCPGDKYYSTDGTCGIQHGSRQCAGKWGDCCNMSGVCGNGTAFCGNSVCQSGNCEWKTTPTNTTSTSSRSSSTTSNTNTRSSTATTGTTTTTKTTSTTTSSSAPTVTNCNAGTGPGGYLGLCSYSSSFGFCPPPCTCTSPGTPNPAPPLTGDHGYAVLNLAADFGPLCEFPCSHGYVAAGVCTTVPYTTTPGGPGTQCVRGVGMGEYTGLCDFSCYFGFCPAGRCSCSLYGAPNTPPPETGTPGVPAAGHEGSDMGLCSFACNHGYCPSGQCAYA
ncbi:hypothetical protein GE09DRAFT_1262512 [Coniochaeta sp. 2T2.1]|nr:hypothetical protein GE09DRAFT_1262512 [Coniochaeta sp. 2T2.1]